MDGVGLLLRIWQRSHAPGLICSASSRQDVRQRFGEVFGRFYVPGCDVEKGVVRNEATQFLCSGAALTALEKLDPRAAVEATSRIQFNLS